MFADRIWVGGETPTLIVGKRKVVMNKYAFVIFAAKLKAHIKHRGVQNVKLPKVFCVSLSDFF